MSMRPSPSKSPATTPRPLPTAVSMPERADTSVNVPSPLLWYRAEAAVAVQAVPAASRLIEQASAVHEIQVEEAVVIHIEQRGAAAHDFGKVVPGRVAGRVDEADAGTRRNLFEPCAADPGFGSRI